MACRFRGPPVRYFGVTFQLRAQPAKHMDEAKAWAKRAASAAVGRAADRRGEQQAERDGVEQGARV